MYRDDEEAAEEELRMAEELCTAEELRMAEELCAAEELRMAEELKTGAALELESRAEELNLAAEEAGPGTESVSGITPGELLYATPASEVGAAPAEEYGITVSGAEVPAPAADEFMSAEIPDGVPSPLPQEITHARRKTAPAPVKRKEGYPMKPSGNFFKRPE